MPPPPLLFLCYGDVRELLLSLRVMREMFLLEMHGVQVRLSAGESVAANSFALTDKHVRETEPGREDE